MCVYVTVYVIEEDKVASESVSFCPSIYLLEEEEVSVTVSFCPSMCLCITRGGGAV